MWRECGRWLTKNIRTKNRTDGAARSASKNAHRKFGLRDQQFIFFFRARGLAAVYRELNAQSYESAD